MPKLTLTIFDPIDIVFPDGKVFTIKTLSSKMLNEFMAIANGFAENPGTVTPEKIGEILTKLLPDMKLEEAMLVDFRYVLTIAEFLAEQITEASKPTKATETKN